MSLIKKYIFILNLFICVNFFAQEKVIDSLKNELLIHKQKDTLRVNLLNELANLYHTKDFNTTIKFLEESEPLADSIKYTKGKAKSLLLRGMSHGIYSGYKDGFEFYKEALKLFKKTSSKISIADCYKNMGVFFSRKGNQNEAVKYYKESLKINEEIRNYEGVLVDVNKIGWSFLLIGNYNDAIAFYKKSIKIHKETKSQTLLPYTLSDLGIIYTYKGNYSLALEYFKESLRIGEKKLDSTSMGNTLGNMGPVYTHMKKYDKAIDCYKNSLKYLNNTNKNATGSNLNNIGLAYLELKEYELALKYITDAQNIYKEINNRASEALTYNNIGVVYIALKKYDKAYPNFKQAKKINLEVDNQRGLCDSYLGIAKVYTNKKQYNNALINALKSKEIADNLKILKFKRNAVELLSKIYNETGNYKKALASHQQFKTLNDSLFNKENIEKIAQLESEYKYKQELDAGKIRELELTNTVKTTEEILEKSQQNLLIGVIVFLLLILILGIIIFILKYRNIKTKTQNIVIEQKLLRSQMTPHFIFNSLAVLQGMILNKEEENSISYLSKFSKLLRTVLENSRHKKVLLIDELKAIESFMELQNLDVNPPFKYKIIIDSKVKNSALKIPPMLIQPFIENAIEHAFPNKKEDKEINVALNFKDEKLLCTIEDNGIGVNLDEQKINKNKKSLATTITSERLKILSKDFNIKGSLTIKNRKLFGEQGTLVTLEIPYKKEVA